MVTTNERQTVLITSPLEPELIDSLRAVAPDRVELIADESIWPPQRYVADHHGPPDFTLPADAAARYRDYLQRATILWDFPELLLAESSFAELAPNVRWVQTTSAGVGQFVARLGLVESDLIVTTSSGVHANALAEFVMLCLLSHVKLLPMLQADQHAHRWERFCSDTLEGKTLAIVGPGRIGRQIARTAHAFDMRVIGLARDARPERAASLGLDELFDRAHLHEMLSQADAVVVSTPHTPETDNLIDRAAFEAMKAGVMFVN
ncbi:MAG TPA: NAD(P)-dependent oxidoreductase, partial [Thermomicrobiaceae bacterium]|nr:NAD(P)-dependent oxidoreductase [Thermomicrobiaceae bacterium]